MPEPERLDRYLVRHGLAPSRRAADAMVAAGQVSVNGRRCRKSDLVDDTASVEIVSSTSAAPIGANPDLALEILYQDAAVIVVNKPGGLPCHPVRTSECVTVMNAAVARFPETADAGDAEKPLEGGLVHRLDNGTSGALLIARTKDAFATLRAAIRTGKVARRYEALVAGDLTRKLELDAPIAHHPKNPRRMIHGDTSSSKRKRAGRAALTIIEPVRRVGRFTLVSALPATGSRHQIRVHLADAGFPIVGDTLYGGPLDPRLPKNRFFLHLSEVTFDSPASGRTRVIAPMPKELQKLLVTNR
ncbi:MAG TPA: RluA family pseudouridine synthase [Candidatus Binataceae bacterium]